MAPRLEGKVALVAGGTRGAGRGISTELGAAGATVYVTGRSTRGRRSEYGRPETIEETAELVDEAGGRGIAVRTDHLEPDEVRDLVGRIEAEQGRLDVLVNDIWGSEYLAEWNVPVWEHSLEKGFRMLRLAIDTHITTSHYALPLLLKTGGGLVVEVTAGTAEYNAENYRNSLFYDLAKTSGTYLAGAVALAVALGAGAIGEGAGTLQHHVDVVSGPGRLIEGFDPAHRDRPVADAQLAAGGADHGGKAAVGGVVAGQIKDGVEIGDLVDRHHPQLVEQPALDQRAQHAAADAAIAVDGEPQWHRRGGGISRAVPGRFRSGARG